MNSILSIQDISKAYGQQKALDRVSLEIPANSIFGLLGPNGAGKTTLIRIINQILAPDSGTVYLDGEALGPAHVAHIGYLPEERGLYKSMKVGEQALYLARLKGLGQAEARTRLKYWFEKLEIGDWWNKKVQELSKGMAQKVQFIVTVLHEPKLLIFDEPFSGFDPINAALIKDQILELREKGASIIFSTHRMESVEELCEHIALIHRSRLILDGRLSDIKKAYKQNRFQVRWVPVGEPRSPEQVVNGYPLESSRFDAEEGLWEFTVRMPEPGDDRKPDGQRHLLNALSGSGSIASFRELIPSANEIFIRTVKNQEANG